MTAAAAGASGGLTYTCRQAHACCLEPAINPAFSRRYVMSASAKNRFPLVIIAVLTVVAAWMILKKDLTYASLFNQPRVNDPQEAAFMQQAFEEIVARRDVKMPLEKQKEIAKLFHDLKIWQNM